MKIISWNILANEFIEEKYYPTIKPKILFNRKERIYNIITILLRLNADVMLLQEVMQHEYNKLVEVFEDKFYIIRGKNINWYNKKSYSGNVTLLRKGIFKLKENSNYDLFFGVYIKCFYLNKQTHMYEEIEIINIHLNDTSYKKRLNEIKSIYYLLHTSKKIILGGDFNQEYNNKSNLYKLIKLSGLIPYIREPTYNIEKKMCIDNIMIKGFTINNESNKIKSYSELNCSNNCSPISLR